MSKAQGKFDFSVHHLFKKKVTIKKYIFLGILNRTDYGTYIYMQ